MTVQMVLKSQYHQSLDSLRSVIEKCPDVMWNDPADGHVPFWKVVYHTLFYTHLYLQPNLQAFVPWVNHREKNESLEPSPVGFSDPAYTRQEMLDYWAVCHCMVDGCVAALDLTSEQCGFPWYSMPTLEHQIVNIRHIQHHLAILSSRLRRQAMIEIPWR